MKKIFAVLLTLILTINMLQVVAYAYNMPKLYGTNTNQRQSEEGVRVLPPVTDPDKMATGVSNVNGDEIAFTGGRLLGIPEKGDLPALGWNSWNAYQTAINENKIKAVADAFETLGLDKVGYEYLVIDDGCYTAAVGGNYNVLPSNNMTNFPSGFKAMSDYIHSKGTDYGGLKYGMYSNSAYRTCASQPAAYAMEDEFAEKLVEWGVDYIKYDFCSNPWNTNTFTLGPALRTVKVSNASGLEQIIEVAAETRPSNVTFYGTAGSSGGGATTVINGNQIVREAAGYLRGIGFRYGDNGYNLNRVPGEVWVEVTVPEAGAYDLGFETSVQTWSESGTNVTAGRCLQVDVNGTRVFDTFVPSGSTWQWTTTSVQLQAGANKVRIYNYKGMESSLESMTAFKDSMINKGGSNIRFSLCEWGGTYPWNWAAKVGDSYRMVSDIKAGSPFQTNYGWKKLQYDRCVVLDKFTGLDKAWADGDMMVIGDIDGNPNNTQTRFTYEADKQHFTEWCMIMSPIMLGNDLPNVEIGSKVHEVITNKDAIALSQDPLAIQAKRIKNSGSIAPNNFNGGNRLDVLAKPLANGDVAIMFNNVNSNVSNTLSMTVTLREIIDGIGDKMVNKDTFAAARTFYLTDIWTKETSTVTVVDQNSILSLVSSLPGRDQRTYRISLTPPEDITTGLVFDYKDLAPNRPIRVMSTSINASEEPVKEFVLIALYGEDGKLEDVKTSSPKVLEPDGLVTLKQGLNLPEDVDGKTLKAFLWDGESYTPLYNNIEL